MNLADITTQVLSAVKKNSPAILTGMAVAGVVTTTVMAVKATPRAVHNIQYLSDEMERVHQAGGPEPEVITGLDIVKMNYRLYIPATLSGLATIACIIGANTVNSRRQAALIGMLSLTENAFTEYKEISSKQLGEKGTEKVYDEIAERKVAALPAGAADTIILDGSDSLCMEAYTGRLFKSNLESIRSAQNSINELILHDGTASLNEFYNYLGLPRTSNGDDVGWNSDKLLDLNFSGQLTEEGKPCLVIDYRVNPMQDYHKFH